MPRQALILHLYNVGLQTHEVAEIMQVSVHTLYKHLSRIFCKFNVHDRGAAIQKGMDCKPKTEDCKLKAEALET